MAILSAIYKLLIGPLELFFEVLFSVSYRIIGDPGFSIIFLSLAMNFLVLPLYRRADKMQEEERDRAIQMKPWVDHIKKTFKGDERFMILQTYYRQCNYKQTDVFKGSVSLLLEIPFFIAAFHFLSNLTLLRGVTFGPIVDLGAPDALLSISGFSINVLPILMTAINVVSAFIYMRGFPLKSKIQMYGIAAIFLVLLYNSPAGLVFYWTLNNIFSLVKNLFYKMKDPKRVLQILASIVGLALLAAVLFVHPMSTMKRQAFVIACSLLLQLPLLIRLLPTHAPRLSIRETTPSEERVFLFGCIFMALLTGILIPLSVIQSSPSEFVNMMDYSSPLWYLKDSFLLATGTFVVWFGVFYRLATPKGKSVIGFVLLIMAGASLVDYLLFGTQLGNLSPTLQFDNIPSYTRLLMAENILIIALVAIALFAVWRKKQSLVRIGYVSMCFAVIVMSIYGAINVNKALEPVRNGIEVVSENAPNFTLSQNGHNVVVIMLDRAIPYYIPYIMNEKPELKESFSGFTCYLNAVTNGTPTNAGSPGLYGGYDYTPEMLNARSDLSLGEKQDEALKVMPLLFNDAGYDVTVFDPTYAGYNFIPDLSIYDDCPGVDAYITMNGRYKVEELFEDSDSESELNESLLSRNFFCYSLFKIAPVAIQPSLYNKGNYNSATALGATAEAYAMGGDMTQHLDGVSKATGVDGDFLDSFAVIENLPSIMSVSQGDENTFLMMSNNTTHEIVALQEPGYVPAMVVDNTDFDKEHETRTDEFGNVVDFSEDTESRATSRRMHYQVNMATMLKLAEWFDYMKECGVYDNTRIILVSDHSQGLGFHEELLQTVEDLDTGETWAFDEYVFNCLLMVKDFDSQEFTYDNTFMTNADTPVMALDGIVDDPVNPFTGNPIDSSAKDAPEMHLFASNEWHVDINNGNEFMPGEWFSVHDDVSDEANWEYLGYY